MQVTVTRDVKATPDKIFAMFVDVASWPRWNSNFRDVTLLTPGGPFGVGTEARLKPADGPEATATVATFEPLQRVVWKAKVMGMTIVITHALAPGSAPGTTTASFETAIEGGLGALMGGFMKTKLEKALNEGIDGLKKAAEVG
jgi:uncharacterized protein YndB with AHSA1/START domain